jgi:hypothetical protein
VSYPYSFIEQWWGESLTPELQKRIEAAPVEHLERFLSDNLNVGDQLMSISPRPDGALRPLLRPVGSRSLGVISSRSLSTALNILLYAHELVIDFPRLTITPQTFPVVTAQLLALKPLADIHAIHFGGIDSRARHPSLYSRRNVDRAEIAVRKSYPSLENEIGADRLGEAIFEVMGTIALSDEYSNRFNALARDELEFKIMTSVLRAAWADHAYFDLTALARMSVPNLQGKIGDLVAIRQSEESFSLWREALSRAIMRLAALPDDRVDWQRDATDVVYSELEPLRRNIILANSRSNALAALNKGMSAMLIGGAGVAAGWAAGGGPIPALASSGASIGIAAAADYLRKTKERRGNKALLDLALAFKTDAGSD